MLTLAAAPAQAVSYVKSVEYVEIALAASGGTSLISSSPNLTKGQNTANCVPFASLYSAGNDESFERIHTDIYFEAGPKVTARRDEATGTLNLGVYVVEFDPTYVNVQQNAAAAPLAMSGTSITTGITGVVTTKAALVFYYRGTFSSHKWHDNSVAGRLSAANQLSFERDLNTDSSTVNIHWYVFEARNAEFAVQPINLSVAGSATFGTVGISSVDLTKSFVIGSYRTAYDSDSPRSAATVVYLSSATQVRAERNFASSLGITDIRAFVVTLSGNVKVQRNSLSYPSAQTQATATVSSVNTNSAIVWNGMAMPGPGVITAASNASTDVDLAFHRLKLANATTVQGDRGESTVASLGRFEVIDFDVPPPTTYYRSIGTLGDTTGGTITVVNGNPVVTKSGGPAWKALNRGRGDRLTVNGTNHYVILSVDSDDQLTLASNPVAGYSGTSYTIARQFTTLQGWEDCVSRAAANSCKRPADSQVYFATATSSLVADDRREVGIAYKDSEFDLTADFELIGSTTDAVHTITLTADGINRHNGVPGAGVVVDAQLGGFSIWIEDSYVTVEWLEHVRCRTASGSIQVGSSGGGTTGVLLQNMLVHDFDTAGIRLRGGANKNLTVRNSMVWGGGSTGIEGDEATDTLAIDNSSLDGPGNGIDAQASALTIRNTVVTNSGTCFRVSGGSLGGSNNTSRDGTAPGTNPQTGVAAASVFVTPNVNLHLQPVSNPAVNTGLNLSPSFFHDIDGEVRPAGAWDRGADELDGFTAVKLARFSAKGYDQAALVEWQTASELDNLGFHLYRAETAAGPWTRLNASRIPGLGSSPEGKAYSWTDAGLLNGTTYLYRLEDVDRSGRVTSHGPVQATPIAGAEPPADEAEAEESDEPPQPEIDARWTAHGDPSDVSLRVLEHGPRGVVVELQTGGFYSLALSDGTVRLHVPGFFETAQPGLPSLPVRRTWVDAVVGRGARITSVREGESRVFPGLVPAAAGAPLAEAASDGTFRVAFRRVRSRLTGGPFPGAAARILETAFQEQTKKAYLELAPLRLDSRRRLVLSGRLLVTIVFDGRVADESGAGGARGRRRPHRRGDPGAPKPIEESPPVPDGLALLARLAVRAGGLQALSWDSLAASPAGAQLAGQALRTSSLRLSRLGEAVAFHVEPVADHFGPGSTLFFVAQGAESAYATEAVYELGIGAGGVRMPVSSGGGASATPLAALVAKRVFEENGNYLPALLNARDPWLWDYGLLPPAAREYPFTLAAASGVGGLARIAVDLQGGSDLKLDPDHLVRVYVNGVPVGEASWDGLAASRFEASFDASVLVEGANSLRLENLDTTGAYDSAVYLDRFTVEYPRALLAAEGRLDGRAPSSGLVRASGFPQGALVLDVSGSTPVWLSATSAGGEIAFVAEAPKSYLAVSPEALLRPEVRAVAAATLRTPSRQADWLVIAPQELLPAAAPLVAHRASQGLRAVSVSLEQVQDEFGYGERSPGMLREFLAYAYHHWQAPSVRYVLLLGDASYDPKGYLQAATRKDLVPSPLVKSRFLWTASDPTLAAVNGDDMIPDLAIGRLTAGTLAEAEAAIAKVLAFEESGQTLSGKAVLVADNADQAGDFEANLNDVATLLTERQVERLFLSQLGAAGTRSAVLGAFDAGAALVSYVGHGSQVLWASEAILRSFDVPLLQPQPRQPLMLTMTCSNGYFVSPFLNGLAERFVLERDKGAIAAFSPSGLSLDEAAHVYHRALVVELEGGRHERLGDLVLAAQRGYADTGAFPELLSLYHLFGDPALMVR